MENLTILESVFRRDNVYWSNLTPKGRKLLIAAELDDFITEDFESDRYHLSNFLDLYQLWDKFEAALGNMKLLFRSTFNDTPSNPPIDWMIQSPNFTVNVLFTMLSNLDLFAKFREYMFLQREQYHQDCFNCGYPLIIPAKLHKIVINHVIGFCNR